MSLDIVTADDNPMHRISVEEMTDEQLQDMIVNKRERRMHAYNIYEESVRMQKDTHNQRLRVDLLKQGELLQKKLATIDKALEAVEKYVVKIITMRNELGLEQHMRGDDHGSQATRNTDAPTEQNGPSSGDVSMCDS